MNKFFSQKGFVFNGFVAFLGVVLIVLVGVVIAVDPITRWRAMQDEARMEGLTQIKDALEQFYDDHGEYPKSSTQFLIVDPRTNKGIEWGKQWIPYLPSLPSDPENGKKFVYVSSPDNLFQTYALYASFYFPEDTSASCRLDEAGGCVNVPSGIFCGDEGRVCNAGLSSPNSSP